MKRILTTLVALIVCSSAAFGQSAPVPECVPWEKFFNYDGGAGAPVPGSLTGSLTAANGVTLTINVVAPSQTRPDGTRPIWRNGGLTIYGGTSGSNVDYDFSAPVERLDLTISDINEREGATITGFLGATPVYPEFISLNFGATITGPNQNIVIGSGATGEQQASARYTFSSPVDRVELRPAPTQPGDFVIHGLRRCGFTSSIELIKSVSSVDDLNGNGIFGDAGDRINYDFFVVNTGNVPLADIEVSDDGFTLLQGQSNLVQPVSGFDRTLAVGEGTGTNGDPGPVLAATATYIIHPTDTAAGMVENTATVSGYAVAADDNGNPVASLRFKDSTGADLPPVEATSDAGSDPAVPTQDGVAGGSALVTSIDPSVDGPATPTLLNLPAPAPSIALTQSIAGVEDTNGNGVFGDAGDTVTYVYTAQNVGNTSLAGVGIAPGDEGFAVSLEGSSVFTPDPSFDLQSGTGGVLAIGSDPVVIGTATYVIAPSDVAAGQIVTQPTVTSTAVATGAGNVPLPGTPLVDAGGAALPPVTDVSDTGTGSNLDRADGSVPNIAEPGTSGTGNDPTVLLLQSTGEFLLTKSAGTERVLIGETVTYEIVATSLMASDFAPTQIVDTLPAGLVFTPGSATIDGVAVEAVVSGQTITFSDLTMPANGSLTIGLQARVLSSAPAGALTNVVDLLDQLTGDALAQTASATVTRTVESVFDCSPVIGKVFDDVNMNGYQDEAPARGAIISDQDIFVDKLGNGGKLSSANVVPQAEVGMPGVRLVTPSGTIITTDANGLYSVPCAEIPSGIGSNFMLKLDTRTLPTGYRMTTENPRVMRLTSGIMTEMNFGAAIGRVFDVDLSGRAYAGDQIAPSAALVDGLNGVLRQIADTPTVVRISYYRNQETAELARDRLNAIEDLIEARWADIGTYRLLIEKSVNQLQ